jgi:hypothetical protein
MSWNDRERRLQRVAAGVRGLPVSADAIVRMVRAGEFDDEPGFRLARGRLLKRFAELLGQPTNVPARWDVKVAALDRGFDNPEFVALLTETTIAFARAQRARGIGGIADDETIRRRVAGYGDS